MIPRTVKRLETTWLTSRQSLPRPARLYYSPSKPSNAPAFATAQLTRLDFPPPLPSLDSFLAARPPLTILPSPLPSDRTSTVDEILYGHSPTQDLISIADACLHELYDVPRAKDIFDRLRSSGTPLLDSNVYNAVLEAYLNMAIFREPHSREYWLESAWAVYDAMESGAERVVPVSRTYAIMLLIWMRFNPQSANPVDHPNQQPAVLLKNMINRNIDLQDVIVDQIFESSEQAAEVVKLLSRAAMEIGASNLVLQLAQIEQIARHAPDGLENVPEVIPVQKTEISEDGQIQHEIPFNLGHLRRHLAQINLARRVLPEDLASRQKLLEESVYDIAIERMKQQADLFAALKLGNGGLMQTDLRRWMWDWHLKLKNRLVDEIRNIVLDENAKRQKVSQLSSNLSPYLHLLQPERLSILTILEVMRLQGTGGVHDGMKAARGVIQVGKAVEVEYKTQLCRKNKIQIPASARQNDIGYFSNMGYKYLQERRVAAAKHVLDGEAWTAPWSQVIRSRIGGILINCLMDVARVTRTVVDKSTGKTVSEEQPAFFHTYEYMRGQKLGVIRLNPVVSDRLSRDSLEETIHARHLPMLVRPKPWVTPDQGGYIHSRTNVMRFKETIEQITYLKHASDLGNIELVYAGLDVLGSTPWRINRRVFDVVLQAWNSGERMGKLPPAVYDRPEPAALENDETDLKARSVYITRMKAYNKEKANNHSERCSVNYKIEVARAFLADEFYFPHNLDFRGRAYPLPPHLNHIGDDLSRGLLVFAEAKPLGQRGLRWLKIHLANLYGFDKANFDERVDFVEKHMDEVYDSATKPLEGRRWWLQADDPWQCLATCIDLHAALESGDPYSYRSAQPVHQDGTCNGLQHYAALGGDKEGAAQVNLSASDRPSDVYTHVGKMVESMVAQDAERGNKYAIMLKGKISRKLVKQTVMTTVYGVTFVGAREQIEKQLHVKNDFPEEHYWDLATYVAKLVLLAIQDLFRGAKDIQVWLNLCARLISKSIPAERLPEAMAEYRAASTRARTELPLLRLRKEQMTSVVWTTPLGLPIVQPYRKKSRKQVSTALQTVYISDPNSPAEVNAIKQASAFPPNFIHSLDATHMILTALKCNAIGITFASVHDSYWTHASSIDQMSEVIRETFVALHSADILKKLREEFVERYKDYKIPLAYFTKGKTVSQLLDAGTQLEVTPENAESLKKTPLQSLIKVVKSDSGESTSDESRAQNEDDQDMVSQDVDESSQLESETWESQDLDADVEDDYEDMSKRLAGIMKRKAKADKEAVSLQGRFIDLVDLLPPLPEKGDFRVEAIKSSEYFFS